MMIWLLIAGFCAFALTVWGVGHYRDWSVRRNVLDIPNERSSHSEPTPRGGGIVIFAVCLAGYAAQGFFGDGAFLWSYLAGAVLIAAISLWDDFRHLPVVARFGVHSLAAVLIIAETGGFTVLEGTMPAWAVRIFTFFWIVWLVNSYNFMDGIDGIAGLQAVTAGICWAGFGYLAGVPSAVFMGAVVGASSLGFLYHNWAPARIFMGDAGAAFLGFTFAVIPFFPGRAGGEVPGWFMTAAAVPVWFFLFDSVYTFLQRLSRRDRVWRAHREHVYQRLVIRGAGHASVTLLYGFLSAGIGAAALILGASGRFNSWFYLAALCAGGILLLTVRLTATVSETYPKRFQTNKGENAKESIEK